MRTVYKLLDAASEPGKLLSFGTAGVHEVEYKPGETVYHYNMFAFDTLEHARLYANYDAAPIWECQTSTTRPAPVMLHVALVDEWCAEFWEAWGRGNLGEEWYNRVVYSPLGTLVCDDLKLIREVARDE